jgi:hypothetical protein
MTNQEKYKFEEFTIENYKNKLLLAKENGFQFSSFHSDHELNFKEILWRHDVEFSPLVALQMAEIETKEGIKATYFFQLHSELYNLLEKEISKIVFRIIELDHDIGLHFDSHYFDIKNETELEKYLKMDKDYFNTVFRYKLRAFSFHNTNRFTLSCEKNCYAGLVNVYSRYFKENFSYCADSTGYWRFEPLNEVLKNPKTHKLQVLTHDSMWSEFVQSPRQRVFQSIDSNAQRQKNWYDNTLHEFGAKNIDWENIYE